MKVQQINRIEATNMESYDGFNQNEAQRCTEWIEKENLNGYGDGSFGYIEVANNMKAEALINQLEGFKYITSEQFELRSDYKEYWRYWSNGIELLLLITGYMDDGEQSIVIGHPNRLEQIKDQI